MGKEALRVCVTGAAGQLSYSLLFQIAEGNVFGADQPLILQLLEIERALPVLEGVVMELQDCALPLIQDIIITADPMVAFRDVDAAFLVASVPFREGMLRKDLLKGNVQIFKLQGEALDKVAKKTVKVVMVANPANTNAVICSKYAPSIPKENITALTRLDHNRAQAQIASRLKVPNSAVSNCIIWGNHSSTQFPDVTHAKVEINGQQKSVVEEVANEQYLHGEFIETVQERAYAVVAKRKNTSAMSAAKAACDHMRDWFQGTAPGRFVSMAVFSDGSYQTPQGVMFSFPVTISADGRYSIVQGLPINEYTRAKLDATGAELCQERDEALAACVA